MPPKRPRSPPNPRKVSWGQGQQLRQGRSGSGGPTHRLQSPVRPAMQTSAEDEEAAHTALKEKIYNLMDDVDHDKRRDRVTGRTYDDVNALKVRVEKGPGGKMERLMEVVRVLEKEKGDWEVEVLVRQGRLYSGDSRGEDNGKDADVCRRMAELIAEVRGLGDMFPSGKELAPKFFDQLLVWDNRHLIHYLGCLAIAGKHGVRSWKKLLTEQETRSSLVVGMIGRALKEHVFTDLWFGASPEEKGTLHQLEMERADMTEGFERNKRRAAKVLEFNKQGDEKHLQFACQKMTMQLEKMLSPLWDGQETHLPKQAYNKLGEIVWFAASLSRDMCMARDAVYYWPPIFKDEEFDPSRMECINLRAMIEQSPYEKKKVEGRERAVLAKGCEDRCEAIVRIVCFPGLVVYRSQGGKLATKELQDEKNGRPGFEPPDVVAQNARHGQTTVTQGYRSKVICKGVVFGAWDKQRLLTKEAGTSAHIDAQRPGGSMQKYDDDYVGFVDLMDLITPRR